jgi:hypothetical protein
MLQGLLDVSGPAVSASLLPAWLALAARLADHDPDSAGCLESNGNRSIVHLRYRLRLVTLGS